MKFSTDEINLLLSSVGLALTVLLDPQDRPAREQLLALQAKLMEARDGLEA